MGLNLIMANEKFNINFLLYKYKYLYKYIYIGLVSVLIELLILNFLVSKYQISFFIADITGLITGILFAFILNFYLNFKLRFNLYHVQRTFLFFLSISIFSWLSQKLIQTYLINFSNSYELNRLISSGVFFLVAYYLHRRITFKNYKKIGFALYLNKEINYKEIFKKVSNCPDFIHLDVVDNSFIHNTNKSDFNQFNKIKKYWPNLEIQSHIMSKKPSKYIEFLSKVSSIIYIHYEIDEDLNKVRKQIKKKGIKFGIAITLKTNPKNILNIIKKSDGILLLSINKPGFTGQEFQTKAFEYINYINKLQFKKNLILCVDGGINEQNNKIIDSDYIVSNSSILKSINPKQQIFKFKSNSYYEL